MVVPIDLRHELQDMARQGQVDLFGVADLAPARQFIAEQGGSYVAAFPRAVSIGYGLSPAMVESLSARDDLALGTTYHEYIYNIVNRRLNDVALDIVRALSRAGFLGYLVPASQTVDTTNFAGIFSHKLAAHLGGLGFIGRACLLVTPRFGARVRFATVLTDAPLPADVPAGGGCGACRRCVDICPARAFTGAEFRPDEPRDARMRAAQCRRYMDHREQTIGRAICGMCVYVCDGRGPATAGKS